MRARTPATWPRAAAPAARPRGMTLVDLMVGLTIGLFVVAVMGAIYQGSRSTFVAQESSARIQENGRFVMDLLANGLRQAGFRGCWAGGSFANTLNQPTTLPYDFERPLWASRASGGGWQPALSAPVSGLAPDAAGDVLVLRRPVGSGWSLIDQMASPDAALAITPTANFARGDLLVVADCGGAAVLQATNAGPGAAGRIEHATGVAGLVPGLSSASLGRVFANDALVWRVQTVAFFLAPSGRRSGEMALWSFSSPAYDGAPALQELATGVERFGVTLGLDTNGDAAADRMVAPAAVANWSQVVSARVELVLVGQSAEVAGNGAQTAVQPQPYVFGGVTVQPSDRRLRTVMSAAVSLRNAVP